MQKTVRAKTVGIREMRLGASKILRRVREKGEAVDITYRGQVIARIIPAAPAKPDPQMLGAIWADLDRVAEEIGRRWPAGLSAAEAVSAERR
jgi:antitoxin (DNA-binding transcriptional repressor) of toxin-antitoxin stability system